MNGEASIGSMAGVIDVLEVLEVLEVAVDANGANRMTRVIDESNCSIAPESDGKYPEFAWLESGRECAMRLQSFRDWRAT